MDRRAGAARPAGCGSALNSRPPPLPKGASNSGVPAPGERRPRERPRSGPERPRPPHKSFGVSIARPRTSLPTDHRRTRQVFGRRLSKERWERHGLPRRTTDGVTCPSTGSFELHRGHRARVVPALAHVLLVRRVTRVLATVVAAELLARLDLASAPHVLAVHPTSSPAPRACEGLPRTPSTGSSGGRGSPRRKGFGPVVGTVAGERASRAPLPGVGGRAARLPAPGHCAAVEPAR